MADVKVTFIIFSVKEGSEDLFLHKVETRVIRARELLVQQSVRGRGDTLRELGS